MSGEEEKLREYLGNNKPKKNLKSSDELNLDSVNLHNNSSNLQHQNNTQILNNKTSNKRDYDKEPLILKDFTIYINYHNFICLVIISVVAILFISDRISLFVYLSALVTILIFDFLIYLKLKSENYLIKLHNKRVEFFSNTKPWQTHHIATDNIEFLSMILLARNAYIFFNFVWFYLLFY